MRTGFIDWTEKNITLYVFEQNKRVDTVTVPVEGGLNPSSLTPLLRANPEQVYLSVPFHFLTLRELTFPFSDKLKIKDTISYELEGLLLGSVSDYSIDHTITETFDSGCRVLAVCLEKTKLGEIINTFSSAGLEPRVITSIDLSLSGSKTDKIIESLTLDSETRLEAAERELAAPSLNLRQDEHSYTGDIERMKRTLRLTASLFLILMLILGAHAVIKLAVGKKENKALTQELQTVYHSVFPGDKKVVDAVRQFKGNLNILKEKNNIFVGIRLLDILNSIATLKSQNIVLNEFTADGKNLIMKGTASSFEEVDSFKNSLRNAFEGIKVLNSDATVDKKINFTIIMQEKTV
jgi:type II secretory pathway component PulL